MASQPGVIVDRQRYSEQRIGEIRQAIAEAPEIAAIDKLCIYATGSYARLEASSHSDLDIFLIAEGSEQGAGLSRVQSILLSARLINIAASLHFPEFSGDGEYLQVHQFQDIVRYLGTPDDDHRNYFTARLLLLLESRPLSNDALYESIVNGVVEDYYRDYKDHETDFRPIFLVNDVIRFWKTLCLNYEARRNERSEDPGERARHQLKNLKLKFSRMLTCFSTILVLAREKQIDASAVAKLTRQTPLERTISIANAVEGGDRLLQFLLDDYAWFLEKTGRPKKEVLDWLSDLDNRRDAFARAQQFGSRMYELLVAAADPETVRYLVI